MVHFLDDLSSVPYMSGVGLHYRHYDFSIILSSVHGIYSNGIDTYEVMLPSGEVEGHISKSEVNRYLLEAQLPLAEAQSQYPEFYI